MLNAKVDLRFDLSMSYALRLRCPTVGYNFFNFHALWTSDIAHRGRASNRPGSMTCSLITELKKRPLTWNVFNFTAKKTLLQSFVVCLDVRLRLLNGVGSDCSESNPKQVSHLASDIVLLRH